MDPALSQALTAFLGALTTAILMGAAYFWGPAQRGARRDEHEHRDEWEHEDETRRESRHNQDMERDFHRRHISDDET